MAVKPNAAITPPADAVDVNGLPPDALSGDSVAAQAQAHLNRMKTGQDIPPNSPLSPQPSAMSRFAQGFGLPSLSDIIHNDILGLDDRSGAFNSFLNAPNSQTALQLAGPAAQIPHSVAHTAAMLPAQIAGGNYAGAAGGATNLALTFGAPKILPKVATAAKVTGGAVGSMLGETPILGRAAKALVRGGKNAYTALNDRGLVNNNFNYMNAMPETNAANTALPSLRPITPPPTPFTPAAFGDAPVQPLLRPRVPGPDFDPVNPTIFSGGQNVSPPPVGHAMFGDAPTQPLIQPRPAGPDFFDPGNPPKLPNTWKGQAPQLPPELQAPEPTFSGPKPRRVPKSVEKSPLETSEPTAPQPVAKGLAVGDKIADVGGGTIEKLGKNGYWIRTSFGSLAFRPFK